MSVKTKSKSLLFFLEALFFLYCYKILLCCRNTQKVLSLYKNRDKVPIDINKNTLRLIKVSVARADRFAFWKNRCIVKSCAAKSMVCRRGGYADIYLGVRKNEDNKLKAHAWLVAQDYEIVNKGNIEFPATTKV